MERSAHSASSTGPDSDAAMNDSAWETVTKRGSKGGKSTAAAKANTSGQSQAASDAPNLQTQASGLSQTSRVNSMAEPGLQGAMRGPAMVQSQSTGVKVGDDSREPLQEQQPHIQAPAKEGTAVAADQAASQAAAGMSQGDRGKPAQQATSQAQPAKPANWAGLLKSPKHAQRGHSKGAKSSSASQQHNRTGLNEQADGFAGVNATVGPRGSHMGSLMPSQINITGAQGLPGAQGPSESPSESELRSAASSPVGSSGPNANPKLPLASDASWSTSIDSMSSAQEAQSQQVQQQLQANAAIWGSGLSSGGLTGIAPVLQLPLQQQQQQLPTKLQQPVRSFESSASASSVPDSSPWDATPAPVQVSAPPQSAKPAIVKSVLVPSAQPFIPQAQQSASSFAAQQAQQAQQARFQTLQGQQRARPSTPTSQQHQPQKSAPAPPSSLSSTSSIFLPSNLYSLQQQPHTIAQAPYLNGSGLTGSGLTAYGSMGALSHGLPAQSASLLESGASLGIGSNPGTLQQLQRQRMQLNGVRSQQQQQQQQLSDIWQQPSLRPQQKGGRPTSGLYPPHQQPPGKGSVSTFGGAQLPTSLSAGNGPAFQQQPDFASSSLQRQPAGHKAGQQGKRGQGHANQANSAAASNAAAVMASRHLSSNGNQSEDDELLSGVFNKVWEDNLQVSPT